MAKPATLTSFCYLTVIIGSVLYAVRLTASGFQTVRHAKTQKICISSLDPSRTACFKIDGVHSSKIFEETL